MLLSGNYLKRGQPIPFLSPPRRLRPSMREVSRKRRRPKRVKQGLPSAPPPYPPKLAALIRGCRFPAVAPFISPKINRHRKEEASASVNVPRLVFHQGEH